MGIEIIPPSRREKIVNDDFPERRLSSFFEEIVQNFKNLPDQMPHISDATGTTIAGNEAKINEILVALQNSGLMAGP